MFKGHAITYGRLYTWTLTVYYNKDKDALTLKAPWRDDGIWVDLPDHVRVRVDPQTGDAIEIQIMAFLKSFLPTRPHLAPLWSQVKPVPIAWRRGENTPFIPEMVQEMERLTYDRARQLDPAALP